MKTIGRGVVFEPAEGGDDQSCTFPSIAVLGGGRWVCAFRAAPGKQELPGQRAVVTWSDDQGRSWSKPIDPFVPPILDGKPGRIRTAALTPLPCGRILAALSWVDHSDPALPFFNERTQGLLDTRALLSVSDDRGRSWSAPGMVNTDPFTTPTPTTGPILALGNGELACPFELNKPYDAPGPWRHRPVLVFSKDSGQTWTEHAVVAEAPANAVHYWDQRPAVLPDGRLLNVFWTYETTTHIYRNIHASTSADHGRTWSPPADTGVPGQPAQPVALPDGRLVLVHVDRTLVPAIRARLSEDGGATWPEQTAHTLYQSAGRSETVAKSTLEDAWREMSDFSVGLPAAVGLDDGSVLVVHYAGPRTDHTAIHWARFAG